MRWGASCTIAATFNDIFRKGTATTEFYLTNASVNPPSTGNTCPVIFDDRSEAR